MGIKGSGAASPRNSNKLAASEDCPQRPKQTKSLGMGWVMLAANKPCKDGITGAAEGSSLLTTSKGSLCIQVSTFQA